LPVAERFPVSQNGLVSQGVVSTDPVGVEHPVGARAAGAFPPVQRRVYRAGAEIGNAHAVKEVVEANRNSAAGSDGYADVFILDGVLRDDRTGDRRRSVGLVGKDVDTGGDSDARVAIRTIPRNPVATIKLSFRFCNGEWLCIATPAMRCR
jgi:hypothetical protein